MRTGVITQKIGMTRLFQADGTHVPVTVLKLDGCAVIGTRTKEKDGYTAVQLGAEPSKRLSKPESGQLKDLPKVAKIREFRVDGLDGSDDHVDPSTLQCVQWASNSVRR